jgi:hypothetical protein
LEERVPKSGFLPPEEALAQWTLRYFLSHGPAQLKDFAWWSGLTLQEAQRGLDLTQGRLLRETVDGITYWRSPTGSGEKPGGPDALLLSLFDEYVIAYKDRSALDSERYLERLISGDNRLTSVLALDGKIVGTWKRVIRKEKVEIVLRTLRELRKVQKEAIEAAASGYAAFLELPMILRLA